MIKLLNAPKTVAWNYYRVWNKLIITGALKEKRNSHVVELFDKYIFYKERIRKKRLTIIIWLRYSQPNTDERIIPEFKEKFMQKAFTDGEFCQMGRMKNAAVTSAIPLFPKEYKQYTSMPPQTN